MDVTMQYNQAEFNRVVEDLRRINDEVAPKSVSYALNKVGQRAIAKTAKDMGRQFRIPQKYIRKKMKIAPRARWRKPRNWVRFYQRDIPFISVGSISQVKRGVDSGALRVGRNVIRNAFVNVVRDSGKQHVLYRKEDDERYPIDVARYRVSQFGPRFFYPNAMRIFNRDVLDLMLNDFDRRMDQMAARNAQT